MTKIVDFFPGNDPCANALALQKAVDRGGEISVTVPGVYDLSEPVELGDDTFLTFGPGVIIRRQPSPSGQNGNAFINKGAFTGIRNRNLGIRGLHLLCNGVESSGFGIASRYVGLRAQVGFVNVENLVVEEYRCEGLLEKDYGLQVTAFENVRLEGLYIEGRKDGVHLGWGRGFTIRHGRFRTFDDPIALNAFDYSVSNTHVGWIEDGLIEDCWDLADTDTVGYFCRILGGAWRNWHYGMIVQHSDTVCHNGRIYRVVMNPTDGKQYTSVTAPCHSCGVVDYDGIHWVCTQESSFLNCGCRNIHLRDIHLQKKRAVAVAIDLNCDTYARSWCPGCEPVPQDAITLENVCVENEVIWLLRSNYPTGTVTLKNIDLGESRVGFFSAREEVEYPTARLVLENVTMAADSICTDRKHKVQVVNVP